MPGSQTLPSLPGALRRAAHDHQQAGPFRVGKPFQRLHDAPVNSASGGLPQLYDADPMIRPREVEGKAFVCGNQEALFPLRHLLQRVVPRPFIGRAADVAPQGTKRVDGHE